MPRKTLEVATLLTMANNYLKNSEDEKTRERLVIADFIDSILH